MAVKKGSRFSQKPDHLINRVDRSEWMTHMRISSAVASHDEAVVDVEVRWGSVDRLKAKVPPDLADRLASAQAKLDDAIEAGDADLVARKAAVVAKGLSVLEEWCRENGVDPQPNPMIVATGYDGRRIGIVKDVGEVKLTRDGGKADGLVEVFSLEEVANIVLSHTTALVSKVKDEFPGAKITAVDTQADFDFNRGDEIPF